MKKNLLIIFSALLFSLSLNAQDSIPNEDFEHWTTYNSLPFADYWFYGTDTVNPTVERVSPGYSGKFAIQLKTTADTVSGKVEANQPTIDSFNPTTFGNTFSITEGWALPTALTGYYKFSNGSATLKDSALISITMYDNSSNETGGGNMYISTNTSSFVKFTLPITYFLAATEGSASIDIIGSVASVIGTTLILDDLKFTSGNTATAVKNATAAFNIILYPNPAAGAVTINNLPPNAAQITITDYTGRIIKTAAATTSLINIDLNNVTTGLYFYSVTDNSGAVVYSSKFAVTE